MKNPHFFMLILVLVIVCAPLPVRAQAEMKTIYAKTDAPECGQERHFVINQVAEEALAPSAITIELKNGTLEEMPLSKFTGKVAHYTSVNNNLDVGMKQAWTQIYASWSGEFNYSHGPCGPTAVRLSNLAANSPPDIGSVIAVVVLGLIVLACIIVYRAGRALRRKG